MMSTKRSSHASAPRTGRSVGQWLAVLDKENPAALRAEQLLRLNRLYSDLVPPPMAKQSRLANVRDGVAIVYAQSGAVAHRLRLTAPTLLAQLRARGVEATELRVLMQPTEPARTAPPKRAILPSAAVDDFAALAQVLTPSPLKNALERLAARARRNFTPPE